MKIKKGDKVLVISGKDRGKSGTVELVNRRTNKVVVSGVNLVTLFEKKKSDGKSGGLKKVEGLISVSKVMLLDPKDDKPTRAGYKFVDGKRIRISKRSGEKI